MSPAAPTSGYLNGQLLLAMPDLEDPRFRRSVVAICAHNESGAFGVCLHHAIPELTVRRLMEQVGVDPLGTPLAKVLMGGPVEASRGFVLHSPDFTGEDTFVASSHFALTGTRDILESIAKGTGPARWLSILGYAGWGAGQLEDEIRRNSWLPVPVTERLLWETAPDARWKLGFETQGVDVALLTGGYGRA